MLIVIELLTSLLNNKKLKSLLESDLGRQKNLIFKSKKNILITIGISN